MSQLHDTGASLQRQGSVSSGGGGSVSQCRKCGTLTMMSQCINCNTATIPMPMPQPRGPVSAQQPRRSVDMSAASFGTPQAGVAAPSPYAAAAATTPGGPMVQRPLPPEMIAAAAMDPGNAPEIHTPPPRPMFTGNAAGLAGTPTTSTSAFYGGAAAPSPAAAGGPPETAALRGEVERLSHELSTRELELKKMRATVESKSMTKHELEELWRTVDAQTNELEAAKKRDDETNRLREKYQVLVSEKDQWMLDRIEREERSADAMTRKDSECEVLRTEVRRLQRELGEANAATDEARQQARIAESALETHKLQVSRMTEEVRSLQSIVNATNADEAHELSTLRAKVRDLEDFKRSVESEMVAQLDAMQTAKDDGERLREHIKGLNTEKGDNETRVQELETQLKLSEVELRAAQEEVMAMRDALRHVKEHTPAAGQLSRFTSGVSTPLAGSPRRDRDEAGSPMGLQVESRLAPVVRSMAAEEEIQRLREEVERSEELKVQLDKARHERTEAIGIVEELRNELQRVGHQAQRRLDDEGERRAGLEKTISELRASLAAAQESAKARESDGFAAVEAADSRVASMLREEKKIRDELHRAASGLNDERSQHAETKLLLSQSRAQLEQWHVDHRNDVAEAVQRERSAVDTRLNDTTSDLEEARTALQRLKQDHSDAIAVEQRRISSLQLELATAQQQRDEYAFEVERLKLNPSPSKLTAQRDQYQDQIDRLVRMRDEAERRVQEQLTVVDSLQKELAEARVARSDAELEAAAKHDELLAACQALGATSIEEVVPKARLVVSERESAREDRDEQSATAKARIANLESELLRLSSDRERFSTQQTSMNTKLHEAELHAEVERAALEAKLADAAEELQRERDWLNKELDTARLATDRERRSAADLRTSHTAALAEKDEAIRVAQAERDNLAREQAGILKESERLRSANAEAQASLANTRSEISGMETTVATMDVQMREQAKTLERLKLDKTRLTQDLAALRGSNETEVSELRSRAEESDVRHTKELENVRATLRVEREKLLKEIEKTHVAESRVSDLEIAIDAIRAERDRATKEAELHKRTGSSRVEAMQQATDAANGERDALMRDIEDLRGRYNNLLRDHDTAAHHARQVQGQLEDMGRQRDQLISSVDSYRIERDAAVRTAMEFSAVHGAAGPSRLTPLAAATPSEAYRGASPLVFDRPQLPTYVPPSYSQHPAPSPAAPGGSRSGSPAVQIPPGGALRSPATQLDDSGAMQVQRDAMLAHFREQQHSHAAAVRLATTGHADGAGNSSGAPAAEAAEAPTQSTAGNTSFEGQPLSAYR